MSPLVYPVSVAYKSIFVLWILFKQHSGYSHVPKRKLRRLAEEEMWDNSERDFRAYIRPLETVTSFKYLGRVLTTGDEDWPAMVGNLKKARKSWARLIRILGREGADSRVSGVLFKVVV